VKGRVEWPRLSFSFSIVLASMMAGTEHPNPISIGMNALPDNPKWRSSLSMMKAALAIYPESSRKERNKNSSAIWEGR